MPEPRMKVSVAPDRSSASLSFLPASGLEGEIQLDLQQIDNLIARLGQARGVMVSNLPIPPIEGASIRPIYQTRWGIQPEALTEGTVIAFQHPSFGPVAFVLAPPEVERVVRTLNAHLGMVHSSGERPRPS